MPYKSTLVSVPRRDDLKIYEEVGHAHLLCTVAVDAEVLAAELGRVLAVDVPLIPGPVLSAGDRAAMWLSPRSWLIRLPDSAEDETMDAVLDAFPDRAVHISRYSDQLCWLGIEGAASEKMLAQGGYISLERTGLPVGHVKRTLFADVSVLIWRRAQAEWSLAVERSRADYLAEWLAKA